MKFLGMQIMIEGLALGAFGMLYQTHAGAAAARSCSSYVIPTRRATCTTACSRCSEHYHQQLTERERREREDWAFEVALLMRNRFLAHEFYEEYYGARDDAAPQWDALVLGQRDDGACSARRCSSASSRT